MCIASYVWGDPIIAASLPALIGLGLAFMTFRENRKLQQERLVADMRLAEKRTDLERQLALWRRKTDLAEQALTLALKAREVFAAARGRGIGQGEGSTRKREPGETDDQAETRDTYWVTIERLNRDLDTFVQIQSLRYTFAAYFGQEAAKPLLVLTKVLQELQIAAGVLMHMVPIVATPGNQQTARDLVRTLFASPGDPIETKINDAVAKLERTCGDTLRSGADWAAAAGS